MLANGTYILQLPPPMPGAHGYGRHQLQRDGQPKAGELHPGVHRLDGPRLGHPDHGQRTYDTLNANESQDFGYGWSLDYRDTTCRRLPKTDDEEDGLFQPVRVWHAGLHHAPGGQTRGIHVRANRGRLLDHHLHAEFRRRPGVTDQLTVEGEANNNQGDLAGFADLAGQGGADHALPAG